MHAAAMQEQCQTPMAADQPSRPSTPAESEDSMACELMLTTLAGNEKICRTGRQHSGSRHCHYADAFGCEVDLVHSDTQEQLRDPTWNTLRIKALILWF